MFWSRACRSLNTVQVRLTLVCALLLAATTSALLVVETITMRRQFAEALDDALLADLREFEALYLEFGLQTLAGDLRRAGEARGTQDTVCIFRTPGLRCVASSDLGPWHGVPLENRELSRLRPGDVQFRTLAVPELRLGLRLAEARLADGNYLQVGQVKKDEPVVRRYRALFIGVLGGMLVLGVGLTWLLVGRAMAGVRTVTHTASGIGRAGLAARVPHAGRGREMDELADAFNAMLDRIEISVRELREVTDNIAHDLRSPLTRIRGMLETVAADGESLDAYRGVRGAIVEECDGMVQMINTMLAIAEASAGLRDIPAERVDLAAVVAEAHELFEPVAEEKGIALRLSVPAEQALVSADLRAIRRIVANLIDNALKYTPAGGSVELAVGCHGGMARISVADTGCGIPASDLPKVFCRFYRGEESRSTPGNGLGLALAQALAAACGGTIRVTSKVGVGSCFEVEFAVSHATERPGGTTMETSR